MSILRVDTIQHSNGTAALTIDSSGRVLSPNKPAFIAYNNGASAIVGPNIMTYNIERLDASNSMNISTGIFTAPVSGLYFFGFNSLAEINNTSLTEVFFRKNSAALNYTRTYDAENVGTAYGPTSVITTIEQMSANDTMQVYLNSGSSHGNSNGQFYGYLIG
jgi:hypothetical protein